MKTKLLATAALAILAGCSDSDTARRVLAQSGYVDVSITGYSMFGCSKDDSFATGFTATAPNGDHVIGVVCSGWFKGATVRLF